MSVTTLPVPDDGDEELDFDVNTLTLGEVEVMEEIVGRDVMRELSRGDVQPSVKTLLALVYVIKRRTNPAFTLDDARARRVTAVKINGGTDPKEPAG